MCADRVCMEYVTNLRRLLAAIDVAAVERVAHTLRAARDAGATVYVAGNGGSASTASHWVNDLCKATKRSGQAPIRAMCLSDNAPWLTALANDEGYDRAFSGQLENFARAGDVFVAISASGNSPNLVSAVDMAQERGLTTLAFLGFDGGLLRGRVDDCVWLPTEHGEYELAEDGHMAVCHILTSCLVRDRAQVAR